MELVKKTSAYWGTIVYDIILRNDKNFLKIFYGGNEDLYIYAGGDYEFNKEGRETISFTIENDSEFYPLFEEFYNNIVSCRVYDESEESAKRLNQMVRMGSSYRDLVQDGKITFYSDNTYNENANLLTIIKVDEGIAFRFTENPQDPSRMGFSIRVCNSGSKYDPFNNCFMNLFNKLQNAGEDIME